MSYRIDDAAPNICQQNNDETIIRKNGVEVVIRNVGNNNSESQEKKNSKNSRRIE